MAESIFGLYKTKLVRNQGPWRGLDDLELATSNASTGSTTAVSSTNSVASRRRVRRQPLPSHQPRPTGRHSTPNACVKSGEVQGAVPVAGVAPRCVSVCPLG